MNSNSVTCVQKILQKYLQAFEKLRIDRAHGIAPHKPILLLSVLQTFQTGINTSTRIYITPELVALFKSNWSLLVTTQHSCRFALPFYHLTSDKFWKLIPKLGFENIMQLSASMRSFANLNAVVDYADIDEDLSILFKDSESNLMLQQCLLNKYFPEARERFFASNTTQYKLLDEISDKILKETAVEYKREIHDLVQQNNDEEIFLRGSVFKREIPKIYNHTCCISGMRIDATISISMIDACHIVPFHISYDDTVTNGIALCPNLHRAFDRGLIAIDENYRVIVSKTFKEDATSYSIRNFAHKKINVPTLKSQVPAIDNFCWHLNNVFKQ